MPETKKTKQEPFDPPMNSGDVTKGLNKTELTNVVKGLIGCKNEAVIKTKGKKNQLDPEDKKMLKIVLGAAKTDRQYNPKVGSVNGHKYKIWRGEKVVQPRFIIRHLETSHVSVWDQTESEVTGKIKMVRRKVFEEVTILNPEPCDIRRKEKLMDDSIKEYKEALSA